MEDVGGYLELIVGPMFSGKTTRLIEIYEQCKFYNIPVIVINHVFDSRYNEGNILTSHNKINIPCEKTSKLKDIWNKMKDTNNTEYGNKNYQVILINEGQFFDDLYETIEEMLRYDKTVHVCGLDGDFERKKFGQILDLIPLSDKITKLTSLCSMCKTGKKGLFSMRITKEKEQTVTGFDNYIPVCRKCYEKNVQTENII